MESAPADMLTGRMLDGRYHVRTRIAHGGMATVYLATDTRLDREVALKVMHADLARDADFVGRFIGEAKSVARLSHPNIVGVYDQGADGQHLYLVMEYVPGRTLRALLRERGWLPWQEALSVMDPVLAGLAAAHRAGIVHRDVKPENVLITADGRVKVVDFGLARARPKSTTLTRPSAVIRTFSGFTSRCTIPARCAAASPASTGSMTLSASCQGSQPRSRSSARSARPGTYSMTRYRCCPSAPWSYTPTMFGWDSLATDLASPMNRHTKSASRARSACMTLSATSRSSRVSVAR